MDVLEKELARSDTFRGVLARIHERQVEYKKFLDNPPSGKCAQCGTYPSSVDEQFLTLKLTVPNCSKVELGFLLDRYFGEQDNRMRMKCSNCCRCFPVCTQEGFCNHPVISQYSLTNAPHSSLFSFYGSPMACRDPR